MSEMVERVAKVISTELDRLERRRGYHLTAESFARLVIAAMREPTKAMDDAGFEIARDCYDAAPADQIWEAMIDEALKP